MDSPLEEPGFELSVPQKTSSVPGRRRFPFAADYFSLPGNQAEAGCGWRRARAFERRAILARSPHALGVAGEDIAAGDVWVATGVDAQIAGVVALAPGDAPGALDLNKLFIEPRHIRSGVGRALLEARRRGAGRLTILADPNAAAFYERAGAVRIGEAPSDAVPGRLLPLYEVRLDSTGDRDLEPHLGGRSKR